jgi:hypothetical protein
MNLNRGKMKLDLGKMGLGRARMSGIERHLMLRCIGLSPAKACHQARTNA